MNGVLDNISWQQKVTPSKFGQFGHLLISSYLVLHCLLNLSIRTVQPFRFCSLACALLPARFCRSDGPAVAGLIKRRLTDSNCNSCCYGLSRVGAKKPHWPSEESRFTVDKPLMTSPGLNQHFRMLHKFVSICKV